MRSSIGLCFVAIGLLLAGCGTTPQDRALSGAGLGAASGAVIGALAGAPAIGAAVGAGVGATVGAATTSSQVDLGKPVWR
jgi:osmotically inducible lipoprotein OsmB